MRRLSIPDEAPPSAGRTRETPAIKRISQLAAVMGLALLSQSGHDTKPTPEAPAAVQKSNRYFSMLPPEVSEVKRSELFVCIRSCASQCRACEAVALATVCGEKPLTPEKLSEAAATLAPDLRKSVHAIAEILHDDPELAPEVLTCLHNFLNDLPMTDPRRFASMIIPTSDASLEDAGTIRMTAREFLRLEREAGVYAPPTPETLTADANTTTMLTRFSNSVEKD
jgi:hypothetical protein